MDFVVYLIFNVYQKLRTVNINENIVLKKYSSSLYSLGVDLAETLCFR